MLKPAFPRTVLVVTVVAVVLTAAPPPLAAGVDRWTPIGLPGGTIDSLAVDPTDADVAYALVGVQLNDLDGPYRTLDGGESWEPVRGELPAFSAEWLALDPGRPARLFLGRRERPDSELTEVFRSDDSGESWVAVGGEHLPLFSVAVAPTEPPVLYGIVGPIGFAVRSYDGGATWQQILASNVYAIAFDPRRPATVYLASNGGFRKSTDGGDHWVLVDRLITGEPMDTIYQLAVSPADPETLYALGSGSRILRSTDGGRRWAARGALPTACGYSIALDAGQVQRLYAACAGGVRVSRDGGISWSDLSTGLPGRPGARVWVPVLATSPSRPAVVYAGTFQAGVYKTTTRGRRWFAAGTGIDDAAVGRLAFQPLRADGLVAGATGRGADCPAFFRSADGGRRWTAFGGPPTCVGFGTLAFPPHDPYTLYVGSVSGLFATRDGGTSWLRLRSQWVETLAFHPTDPATLYAGGDGAFRSPDGGQSWVAIVAPDEVPGHYRNVVQLVVDPARPDDLYAVGEEGIVGSSDDFFLRSPDRGATWSELPVIPTSEPLQIVPGNPSTLYQGGFPGRLRRSTDGGETWQEVPAPAEHLLVASTAPVTLISYGDEGLFRSVDEGETWAALDDWRSCSSRTPTRVAVHPLASDRLFVDGCRGGLAVAEFVGAEPLVLTGSRFEVRTALHDPEGRAHPAAPRPLTAVAGGFAFGPAGDPEAVLKILDARPIDGRFWLFTAALTDAEYTLTVTDVATDVSRDFVHPVGRPTSTVDMKSFPALPEEPAAAPLQAGERIAGTASPTPSGASTLPASPARGPACASDSSVLSLFGGRFALTLFWQLPGGPVTAATALPISDRAGAFWFFAERNLEMVVRMVDRRGETGHFALYAGGMTGVATLLAVTDITTGEERSYFHPAGPPASFADPEAFPPSP